MAIAENFEMAAPGVFHWRAYEPAVKCDLSATALVTRDGLLFIDPFPLEDDALARLASMAAPCSILLTNGNHERGAEEFRRRFCVPIWATKAAAAEFDIKVDKHLEEGAEVPGDLQVVGIPSAGRGEVAFIGQDVAVVGDALIHLDSHGFALLPAKYRVDVDQMPNDIRKLLSYEFHIMTFAHGAPLLENARQRLETLLE